MAKPTIIFLLIFIFILSIVIPAFAQTTILDSYFENFDNRQDGVTINGVDYWKVLQGADDNAMILSGLTYSGSGKSLKLIGNATTVAAGRQTTYGSLSPTWVSFYVRPSTSGQTPSVPSTGIAAVCCDFTGKVLAADGSSWVDTGARYNIDKWYKVSLKIDFKNHTYDVFFTDLTVTDDQFLPDKSGLKFINNTVNSMSSFNFYGSYSEADSSNNYIDDISVTYFYQFQPITASQKLLTGQVSGPITIELQDYLNDPQTAVSDMILELKSTSSRGEFSLDKEPWVSIAQITIPKNAQTATFYYKDFSPGKPIITASEYPDQGLLDAIQEEEIVSQVSYFDVEAVSPQVAGESFKIKVTAKDENGSINDGYGGTVLLTPNYISPASGTYVIVPDTISGFVKGVAEETISYADSGLITITAADGENIAKSGQSLNVLFLPSTFSVTPVDINQIVGRPFNVIVSAKSALGNITPNYNVNAKLYPEAVLPSAIPNIASLAPTGILGEEFIKGIASLDVSYNLYGTIKIKAESTGQIVRSGISDNIKFLPKSVSVSVEPPPNGRDFFYIGEPIGLIIKILDNAGNVITNYPGIVALSSTYGFNLPTDYTFTESDLGQHKVLAVAAAAGDFTADVKAEAGLLKAESPKITVKNATIQVIDTASAVGNGQVIIQLVDDKGNIIKSENNMIVKVTAWETFDNQSVYLPLNYVTLNEGRAVLPIYDTEAETVNITPYSSYKIKVKPGKIVFGRAGKTGISTLMWREIKKKR